MDKNAIKNFATRTRKKLIEDLRIGAVNLAILPEKKVDQVEGIVLENSQLFDLGGSEKLVLNKEKSEERKALLSAIEEKERTGLSYQEAFDEKIDEVAYTYFNKLIAIRFMEVNDYLPGGLRLLSSENPKKREPDLVTSPFDSDLDFTEEEREKIIAYKLKSDNSSLYTLLFQKVEGLLGEVLPALFEKNESYYRTLLRPSYSDPDGIIYRLVHEIDEADFDIKRSGQVEIIGRLYQYYISDKHDEVVGVIGQKPVEKEDIPAATQIFTTDRVVRYMVQNSLGRYRLERNPNSRLKEKMDFYIEGEEEKTLDEKINPQDIKFFDIILQRLIQFNYPKSHCA